MVKFWNPATWQLDHPIELFIDKEATLADFANLLSTLYPDLPASEIQCTKINSPWNFHRVELPFVQWVSLSESNNYISSNPFYLSTDGILFIIRDNRVEMRDMTSQEREMYRCEDFEN